MELLAINTEVKFDVDQKTYFGTVIGHCVTTRGTELKYIIQLNEGFWGDDDQIWISQVVVDSEWVQIAAWWEAEVAGLHDKKQTTLCAIHEIPS